MNDFRHNQLPIVMLEMNAISIKENEEVEEPNTGIRRRTHVTSYIILQFLRFRRLQ